jgi:mpaB/rubber oxygenase-like protein
VQVDDEWLSALRTIGDAPADAYVAAQLANVDSRRREWLNSAIAALRGVTPPDVAWAAEWEDRAEDPPPWLDDDLVRRGQDVFDDWSLDLTTALFCASLPHAYASGRGAAVLASASELFDARRVEKRISLTGQMLLDITTPGGLAVGAVGYRTVRRVRLLHACVRALLLLGDAAGNPWPTQARGLPINQQDLLGTQLAFTIAAFEGIARLGYRMSKSEKQAYLHPWSVVGHYLGVMEASRCTDLTVAKRLTRGLEVTQAQASPWGTELMRTLLDDMSARMPGPLRSLPAALVRRLAGSTVADMLAVPHSRWAPAVAVAVGVERVISRATVGRWALRLPSRLLGRALIGRSIDEGTGVVDPAHFWPDQWLEPERS